MGSDEGCIQCTVRGQLSDPDVMQLIWGLICVTCVCFGIRAPPLLMLLNSNWLCLSSETS